MGVTVRGGGAPRTTTAARLSGALWPLAVANLVANVGIVVTGGAVRLTGSGLGCPTWPRCTDASYVPHDALGVHGAIEFGNRMLTLVLAVVAVGCWLAALARALGSRHDRPGRRRPLVLATVVALGVPAQAVIGGITVRTALNPWVVALHLLVSMAIVGVCVALLDALRGPDRPAAAVPTQWAAGLVLLAGWLVLYLGTVVTGSGPHAGDADARRTGLDPQWMSHLHAWAVYLLVALTVATLALATRAGDRRVAIAAGWLLGAEAAQGAVGFAQYFLDLPPLLVGLHMLGAALVSAGLAWLLLSSRARSDRVAPRHPAALDPTAEAAVESTVGPYPRGRAHRRPPH